MDTVKKTWSALKTPSNIRKYCYNCSHAVFTEHKKEVQFTEGELNGKL